MLEQMLKNMGVDLPAMQTTARDFVARFEVVERQVKEIHESMARMEKYLCGESAHDGPHPSEQEQG